MKTGRSGGLLPARDWEKAKSGNDVVQKVAATRRIGPLLPKPYNCTPGLPPKLAP